jgi:putative nucleotidyltransferase with HDIG domain
MMGEIWREFSSEGKKGEHPLMKHLRAKLTRALIEFFEPNEARIDHALRVLCHSDRLFASRPECDEEIVVAAALLHDVGIKISEERHGYNNGQTQEEYGPPVAAGILRAVGFPEAKIEIVANIIGNHHSPSRYPYPELALLKEADRIVNSGGNAG